MSTDLLELLHLRVRLNLTFLILITYSESILALGHYDRDIIVTGNKKAELFSTNDNSWQEI